MLINLLRTVLDIALYHEALYKTAYILVIAAAAENLLHYSGLFKVMLARIAVIGIDYSRGITEALC